MSYKTNPIANRIKINKGWKNPYLPTKILNYSRDISLWFKIYLLLKNFFNLKKIQLISCEMRFDQENKKILYLLINKKGVQKKRWKKKETSLKSFLNRIKTPLLKRNNLLSKFYLYKNLAFAKNLSFWNKNQLHQKVISKFWLTKPKTSIWVNTLKKIVFLRQISKNTQIYLKKTQVFVPTQHLKLKFYTSKQKQLLSVLSRIKKTNFIFKAKLISLLQQKKLQNLQEITLHLEQKISKNKVKIRNIKKIYKFLLLSTQKLNLEKKHKIHLKSVTKNAISQRKIKFLWKLIEKKLNSFGRARFLKTKLPHFLLQFNENTFPLIHLYQWSFLKKELLLKKVLHLNFLTAQLAKNKYLLKNSDLFSNWNAQSNVYKQEKHKSIGQTENLDLQFFLKTKFCKNTKNGILKQSRYLKTFYNLYFWRILKKKKKQEINFNTERILIKYCGKIKNFKTNANLWKNIILFDKKNFFQKINLKKKL